jgi:hypothetical protein
MGLDLWFREDVLRILVSAHETMQAALRASPGGGEEADAYEQGFVDALRVLALAFGLNLACKKSPGPRLPPGGSDERLRKWLAELDKPRDWRG